MSDLMTAVKQASAALKEIYKQRIEAGEQFPFDGQNDENEFFSKYFEKQSECIDLAMFKTIVAQDMKLNFAGGSVINPTISRGPGAKDFTTVISSIVKGITHPPVLRHMAADTIPNLLNQYEETIGRITDEISDKVGIRMEATSINIFQEAGGYNMVILFRKDFTGDMSGLMSNAKAALENLKGGDPDCEHEWENGPNGLKCVTCGGSI